jgi:hypothetical protein
MERLKLGRKAVTGAAGAKVLCQEKAVRAAQPSWLLAG